MGNAKSLPPVDVGENIELKEEDQYIGEIKDNLYHGKGVLIYSSVDERKRVKYEGDWKYGKRSGKGTLTWANGAIYQGTWSNDKLHGIGIIILPSGLRYEGEFHENKFHGHGVLTWKNEKKYEGSWKENKQHGFGTLTYAPCDLRKRKSYKGEWHEGKRQGQGIMLWNNSAKYEGYWINGKREGFGKHTFPSGQTYVGNWVNGRRDGEGTRYFTNGDKFEGTWKRDKKEGVGYYYYSHGRKERQEYENGKLIRSSLQHDPQNLQVLCIESIGKNNSFKNSIMKSKLPPHLLSLIVSYRENVCHIPQEPTLLQKVQGLFSRISMNNFNFMGNNNSVANAANGNTFEGNNHNINDDVEINELGADQLVDNNEAGNENSYSVEQIIEVLNIEIPQEAEANVDNQEHKNNLVGVGV